jgi:hypothetical protein
MYDIHQCRATFRAASLDILPCCVVVLLAVAPVHAQEIAVGQIGDIWGAARQNSSIMRQDGSIVSAAPGLPLYSGDIVRISPCQPLLEIIFEDMDRDAVRLPDPQCEYRVTRRPPMQPPAALGAVLHRLYGMLFSRSPPPRPIPLYSQGAGVPATAAGGMLTTAPGIPEDVLLRRRDALLNQSETQKLTSETKGLVVLWNPTMPSPYRLTLTQRGATVAVLDAQTDADAVLPLPNGLRASEAATLTVAAGDRIISTMSIAVVDPADEPLAPGLPPTGRDDPKAATLQGLWLLAKGGPEWRLQAMAHLQTSVDANGDFQAGRVLRALISGEWEIPRE